MAIPPPSPGMMYQIQDAEHQAPMAYLLGSMHWNAPAEELQHLMSRIRSIFAGDKSATLSCRVRLEW